MDDLVETQTKWGKDLLLVPNVPGRGMERCKETPRLIIETLKQADGDIEEYINQFRATDHRAKITVLTQTFLILNKPENAALRVEWDQIIEAYKAAKTAIAERAAFHFIGEYKPPTQSGKNKTPLSINLATAYMRLWLGEKFTQATTAGRLKANNPPVSTTGTSGILDELTKGEADV